MDMFAYGCDRVLRELSLVTGKVTLYRTQSILIDLRVSMQEFREILVISGTDYHYNEDGTKGTKGTKGTGGTKGTVGNTGDPDKYHNLYETMKWFQLYRREHSSHSVRQSDAWSKQPTSYYENTNTAWSGYRTKYERRQYMAHMSNDRSDNHRSDGKFYPWLMKHTKYIHDYEALMKIYNMFVI